MRSKGQNVFNWRKTEWSLATGLQWWLNLLNRCACISMAVLVAPWWFHVSNSGLLHSLSPPCLQMPPRPRLDSAGIRLRCRCFPAQPSRPSWWLRPLTRYPSLLPSACRWAVHPTRVPSWPSPPRPFFRRTTRAECERAAAGKNGFRTQPS